MFFSPSLAVLSAILRDEGGLPVVPQEWSLLRLSAKILAPRLSVNFFQLR